MKKKLKKRFEDAHAVPEISTYHGFTVDSRKNVYTKKYSNENNGIKWSMYEDKLK